MATELIDGFPVPPPSNQSSKVLGSSAVGSCSQRFLLFWEEMPIEGMVSMSDLTYLTYLTY